MNLKKNCSMGGLSWAKVLSIALFFVVLLYPNGMTGKALIQEGSSPWGIEPIGDAFRTPGMERGRATPESLRTDRKSISPLAPGAEDPNHRAARVLAGLASDIVAGGSLLNGAGTGKLYLPLIFNNFNPALFAVVPYVLNLTQADAETAILAAQLILGTVTQGTSPTVPAGRVKSQNPAAGLYVAKGAAVDLVISLGPAMVSVPDVFNRPQADAEGLITAAGLLVGTVSQQNSDAVALGNVITQSPPAGTVVAEGTAVDLVISLGKLVAMVQVPATVGQLQADAETAIRASQLTVGTVTFSQSPTVEAGKVISQNPAAGSLVPPGTPVNLVVSLGASGLPPDPVTVAPPLDPTVATTMARSTEFLYTGPTPIQTGVYSDTTIEARRAAVLRGKVLDRAGQPLPAVTITVLNHPEFGQTLSRADGMFDLAVNGGGYLTIRYQKAGYLEAQRQLNVPWQDYVWAPDVVLIPLDSQATAIDLTASTSFQVARGSVTTDDRGTRQSTLLFSQGTQAEIVLPDGTTQPISNLTVRSTEYTVGENGPKAMPGELPLGVGYTYAVELSVDEAMAMDASEVRFSQPVVNYIENFLGFPTGWPVPAYYYDRKEGRWVPFPNGRVIKIVSISGGMADLDVDGDDVADSGTKLTDLGITDAERQRIASLYPAGQSLWRVALLHFSPYDYNWPYKWPPDAYPPSPAAEQDQTEDDPCTSQGSIIECQNQTLGESVRITGTPFTLNYRSSRVTGRLSASTLTIPLTGPTIYYENIFLSVELEIKVAGRKFSYSYPPQPNLSHTFTWDGLDAYGRKVQGAQPIIISLGYKYMGQRCDGLGRCLYWPNMYDILWTTWRGSIGGWDSRGQGLGGWTLDVHHNYDPSARILYMGNGQSRSAESIGNTVITTVAGNGTSGFSGDGGLATTASLDYPNGVAVGQDGSLYIADTGNNRIRRVGPDGIITTVAGNGTSGFSGDGGPATAASLRYPYGVAVGQDGSFYIADNDNHRIRRVGPDGIITTVAGNGTHGFSGDGGPATVASISQPFSIAVGQDGSFYIADYYNLRIRRVGPDGIITTVAGNGTSGFSGDGGLATAASLYYPSGVAVGQDGSLYIADEDNLRIRRVGPDGIINTVAGNGTNGASGDGGPATAAPIGNPFGITVGQDGSFYFSTPTYTISRIRRVGPDGIINTVAGNGTWAFSGDGGPATAASLYGPSGLAVGQDGSLYIADGNNLRIRRVGQLLHGQMTGNPFVASSDGGEVYVFEGDGRHVRTLNTLTGSVVYEFTYDTNGKLIQIKDAANNTTHIEHDTSGNPTAIVSAYGQRTTLAHDSNGYLSGITNPAAETTSFIYTDDGLMTKMTTPRGYAYNYTYDSLGLLTRDADPAGGFQNLTKTQLANGFEVARITSLGRSTTYRAENLATGDKQMTNTFPDGTQTTSLSKTDGTQTITASDGTLTTIQQGPDPRFGMQSPIPKSMTVQTPEGLAYSLGLTRSVSLSNPNDPLSLTDQTDSLAVNGRPYQSQYTAAARQRISTTPEGRQTVTTLDEFGRVVKKERAGIEPISLTYDANGRLATISQGTAGNLRNITLTYNPGGYVQNVTDPLSRTVSFEYDQAGRVTRQILPGDREVRYSYDASGNMTSITPPGRPAHGFDYTQIDLAEEYTPPPAGTNTGATTYTYNADRQLTQVTRPDGKTIALAYDTGGRLNSRTIQRGTTSYAYNAQTGNISSIIAPDGGVLSLTYDGSFLRGVTWQGVVQGSLGLTYDNDLRVVSQSVNGGNTINLAYDNDSLLTQAGDLSISRNSQNGLVTGTALGVVTDTRWYNTFGEITDYSANDNASEFFRVQYTRDKLGRVTEKTETLSGTSKTYTYLYEAAGRLAEVKEAGNTVAAYTYDANGNRQSYAGPGGTTTYTYDDQDRLLTRTSGPQTQNYSYTGNGELASKTLGGMTTTYQYDELGNIVAVTLPNGTQVEYVIDGRNRRIGKKIDTVLTQGLLYKDRLNPVAELDGSGAVISRFVYATRKNVPNYMRKGGATYRIISDHLGSVRLVINTATGEIVQRLDYDAFGSVVLDTNPGFQPFGFAGGLYDRNTKLTRFGVRDYDSETGRWTAKDPIGFDGGDANFYAYVQSNPIMLIDPSGTVGLGDIAKSVNETLKTAANEAKDWVKEKLSDAKDTLDETFGKENVNECLDTAWNFLSNAMCAFLPDIVSPACTIGTGATNEESAKDIYRGVEHLSGKGERWEKLKGVEY